MSLHPTAQYLIEKYGVLLGNQEQQACLAVDLNKAMATLEKQGNRSNIEGEAVDLRLREHIRIFAHPLVHIAALIKMGKNHHTFLCGDAQTHFHNFNAVYERFKDEGLGHTQYISAALGNGQLLCNKPETTILHIRLWQAIHKAGFVKFGRDNTTEDFWKTLTGRPQYVVIGLENILLRGVYGGLVENNTKDALRANKPVLSSRLIAQHPDFAQEGQLALRPLATVLGESKELAGQFASVLAVYNEGVKVEKKAAAVEAVA